MAAEALCPIPIREIPTPFIERCVEYRRTTSGATHPSEARNARHEPIKSAMYPSPIRERKLTPPMSPYAAEGPAPDSIRCMNNSKHLPNSTGEEFQFDPVLVGVTYESDLHCFQSGTGSVTLATTPHDPLGEIRVEEVLGASYSAADIYSSQETLKTVDPDIFLPYAHGNGRIDDWLALDNISESDRTATNE